MIQQILNDHFKFIQNFIKLINSKYNINHNKNILNLKGNDFQREGNIEDYTYFFHGTGCSLKMNNIIGEYDYYGNNITFTLWDLKQFIITNPKYKNEKLSDKYLEIELYKLIEKGELSWKISYNIILQVYQYL